MSLPPLRERLEEVPWHIQHVLEDCSPERAVCASAAFVDACMQRNWPGNARELRAEVRRAATSAAAQGSNVLTANELSPTAGIPIERSEAGPRPPDFPQDEVAEALTEAHGNVVAAARRLGISRNKVRRWLERHSVDAGAFKARTR